MTEKEKKIDEILSRGVIEVIDRSHLRKRLLSGKTLMVKLGIDPTSTAIHLGRAVVLLKLRDFQELGHKIVLILGTATGMIGDTSDKDSERPMLSKEQIKENVRTYAEQAGKILDMKSVDVRFNEDWLGKLGYEEIGRHADQFSLHEFIERDNIKKRLAAGKRVSLREVIYPLMVGYDSVAVGADVELGGIDQRFNLLAGRVLQSHVGQEPQDILMVNLISGTDGRKMSSSWGNVITLTDKPDDMFGKVMSIGDHLMEQYFLHCTRVPIAQIENILTGGNPRDAKLRLASEIVALYHGKDIAEKTRKDFVETFSERKVPDHISATPVAGNQIGLMDFLVQSKNAKSKSDARRKITQGGVEVDGKRITDTNFILARGIHDGATLKIGKYGFAKVTFEK